MKIIAVGWNYRGHNAEMNQKETPQNPIIFFKPETALLKDGSHFFYLNSPTVSNTKPNWFSTFPD